MAQTKTRPATYADIEALPAHMTGEIAFGVLHTMGRPRPAHSRAAGALNFVLGGPFDYGGGSGSGGWIFLPEPEVHFGDNILVPDIAGWRRSTMATVPDTAWIDIVPDWVCEILSPSTRAFDRTDKLKIYAGHGVSHCWLVDPDAKTLEVFELTNRQWLLMSTHKNGDAVCAEPFATHTFTLDALWQDRSPTGS